MKEGDKYDKIERLLKKKGLRRTGPRVAVLGVLFAAERPVSQEEIAAEIGADAPNKVTIYRALESFVEKDIVHKAFLQDRTWHFELAHNCSEHQCHPHFSCTNCGQTHCMTGVSVPMTADCGGYVIEYQRVQLEGLCPKCSGAA